MKKQNKEEKSKKTKRIRIVVILAAVAAIAVFLLVSLQRPDRGEQDAPAPTITLERSDMTVTLSASGVVRSSSTHSIYSTQSYPVADIFVNVGDRVTAGDVLAQLDMTRLENDIAQTELNLQSAENSAAEELRTNANSVTNAQTSLESSRIALDRQAMNTAYAQKELEEAEREAKIPFDSTAHDAAIKDAETKVEEKQKELETAQAALIAAQNAYDDAAHQVIVNSAAAILQEKKSEEALAKTAYENELNSNGAGVDADTKKALWELAERAVEDAQAAFDKATADYKAKTDAEKMASESASTAQTGLTEAERAYEKALKDKEDAIEAYIESNKTRVDNARRTLAESQNQLLSAQNSVTSAANSLEQAAGRPATGEISVDIQTLNLEKLDLQLSEGRISATIDGVITEINATVGANPSGVMFVIEDIDDLYVSANVKEYSLSELSLGQRGFVTTEATAGRVFDAQVTYMSPKAVSPAGSTSVEFEIHAHIDGNDTDVKIGMNAYVNIITDEKSDIYVVPLSVIVTNEHGSFVIALEDGERREVPVALGLRSSTQVEIIGAGLYDGMQIHAEPNDTGERPAVNPFFGGGF